MSKTVKTSVMFAAACAASVWVTSASAVGIDLTPGIINADMELFAGLTGNRPDAEDGYANNGGDPATDGWRAWANSANGNMLRMWNPSATDRSSTQNNQFFDTSWGGVAPQGDQVIAVRTQNLDYIGGSTVLDIYGNRTFAATTGATGTNGVTYDWATDDGGSRTFEAAAQQLTEAFDPTARYILTVQVGRLAEGTGPNFDGSGFNAGANTTTGGTSTRFANDAPVLWNGYTVDLMAGGVIGTGASFAGWLYGTSANPADDDYIGMIAQDNNSLALAQDTWGTSNVAYTPGTGPDLSALAGKPLVIRLAALEGADHSLTSAVAFDDVKLIKIMAGDNDEDGDVDDADLGSAFASYTGPLAPGAGNKTWADGDFVGDGEVDDADLGTAFSNYTGPLAPTSVPEPASAALLALGGLLVARRRR